MLYRIIGRYFGRSHVIIERCSHKGVNHDIIVRKIAVLTYSVDNTTIALLLAGHIYEHYADDFLLSDALFYIKRQLRLLICIYQNLQSLLQIISVLFDYLPERLDCEV